MSQSQDLFSSMVEITLTQHLANNQNALHFVEEDRSEPICINEQNNARFYETGSFDINDIEIVL